MSYSAGAGLAFAESVLRSNGGQEVDLRGSLALGLDELNPAALIFATGSWGRVQDVDVTLF